MNRSFPIRADEECFTLDVALYVNGVFKMLGDGDILARATLRLWLRRKEGLCGVLKVGAESNRVVEGLVGFRDTDGALRWMNGDGYALVIVMKV